MHYQKWGKHTKKIVCYSQQTSKQYLVKDANCDQPKIWSQELEDIVLNDIFQLRIPDNSMNDEMSENQTIKRLKEQIQAKQMELKRLYNLYAESGNEILLNTIEEREKQIHILQEQLQYQEQQETLVEVTDAVIDKVEHLSEVWDLLTAKEKKNILNILIEKIIITDDKIEIRYRL